jgi:hypothetical protein
MFLLFSQLLTLYMKIDVMVSKIYKLVPFII